MTKKKKILLLSDDLRMSSGIATVSKELVFGTFDKYDWVQLGAAVKHPDQGKEIDLGQDARKISGVEDASLKIIPWTGYGDANILRELIMRHQPDAILHFTDPRYWRWLYEMEAELRQNIPILFIIYGMIYQTHITTETIMNHVIGWGVSQDKRMVL